MPNLPGIQNWNRLEPRPRSEDFDRTVRAEVRDALWMMTRQWQFGEFQAEDTGSAIFSRVNTKTSKINKYQLQDYTVQDINTNETLETNVEKETPEFDLLMRLEMGRHWENILRTEITKANADEMVPLTEAELNTEIEAVIGEFRSAGGPGIDLNFYVPDNLQYDTSESLFFSNPDLYQATEAASGRAIDGSLLYTWLKTPTNAAGTFTALLTLPSFISGIIPYCGSLFVQWFERNYSLPESETESGWHQQHMEISVCLCISK